MNAKRFLIVLLAVAVVAGPMATVTLAQDKSIFIPLLVYRTGPYAPNGIPSTPVNSRTGPPLIVTRYRWPATGG